MARNLEEYRASVVESILRNEELLLPLEKGEIHTAEREFPDGDWVDTTDQYIQRHRENIEKYRNILKSLDDFIASSQSQ